MEIVQREPRSLECEWRNDIERNRIGETDTCGRLIEWDACCSATDGWASPPSISPGSIPGRLLANAQLPQTNHVDGVAPAAAKKSHALPGDAPDLAICPVSRDRKSVV